jgi:hypothetical protein
MEGSIITKRERGPEMTHKDALIFIKAIKESGYNPSEWEKQFIVSLYQGTEVSYAQDQKLRQIYEKATGGGVQRREYIKAKMGRW